MGLGRRSLMTKIFAAGGNVARCQWCHGRGFAPDGPERSARRCPKCKGTGRIPVGCTKR